MHCVDTAVTVGMLMRRSLTHHGCKCGYNSRNKTCEKNTSNDHLAVEMSGGAIMCRGGGCGKTTLRRASLQRLSTFEYCSGTHASPRQSFQDILPLSKR